MRRRGRPPTPDVLTPREWEVLRFLQDGLSNREIAERLRISLSGAKYHVSEIISKLGVSTREEAASWEEGQERWGFIPALLARRSLLSGVPLKVALGLFAAVAVGAASFLILGGGTEVDSRNGAVGVAEPTPTPDYPCPSPGESCIRILHIELASWDEAVTLAAGRILEPAYIPSGYERDRLTFSYSDPPTDRLGANIAVISAKFRRGDGDELVINQGIGPSLSNNAYGLAPKAYRGSVIVNGAELRWVQGNPIWEERSDGWHATDVWDRDSLDRYALTWEEPKTGPLVREKSPDGEVQYFRGGQSIGYLIYSNHLSLDELIRVAESMLSE